MSRTVLKFSQIEEVIPCDESFAISYLKLNDSAELQKAIHVGIADADAGKLIDLATVKAKWLSRCPPQR
jgi:predicted transcriptional regulator